MIIDIPVNLMAKLEELSRVKVTSNQGFKAGYEVGQKELAQEVLNVYMEVRD